MNVKLKLLSTGVLFFLGGATALAQEKNRDSVRTTKDIEEVVVVGLKSTTKKEAVISTAKIESEQINNRPNANLMNIAQGQLAGVNISTGTGQPGAKPTVVIRGFSTINGNTDPLYVIDGFPTNADSFRSLNANDVESMEVLKDASATAMYGNRGANGVIVIRTKGGGFSAKTTYNYRSQIGVSMLQGNRYNMSNAQQLLTLENRANVGKGNTMSISDIENYKGTDTDWLNYFFNPALLQGHDFAITTGGKNLSSYTNVGYLEQSGILTNTGLRRFSLRTNVNGKSNDNRLTYRVGVYAGYSKNRTAPGLGTGGVNNNYVIGALRGAPYISPDDWQPEGAISPNLVNTPVLLIDKQKTYRTQTDDLRIDLTSEVNYKITDDLTATMRTNAQLLALDGNSSEHWNSWNANYFRGTGQDYVGWESFSTSRQFNFNNLYQLNYVKRLGNHKFDVLGGFEYNNFMIKGHSFVQNGLNPKTWVPGTGSGFIVNPANQYYVPEVSASQSRLNMYSYFANVDYDYNTKYGIVANVRRDASSRFNKDNRWGTFWSVGARWNINEESFMQNINWVNILKLRGSYGTAGNQRILSGSIFAGLNPPLYKDSFLGASNLYNGTQGLGLVLGSPDLHWETTRQWNAGVDFELFSRRLRGTFDFYEKKGIEIFYAWPQSYLVGQGNVNINSPIDLKNNGVELNIAYDLIRTSNAKLTIRANGAMNKERVYNLPESPFIQGEQPQVYSANGYLYQAPYVYHYLGVNQSNGNLLFEDANGNPTEKPTTADLKQLKYGFNPKYQGGFGFDFNYKGLFVSSTFTYVAKVYRYDYDWSTVMNGDNLGTFNVSADLLNAWTPTNTNTNVPAIRNANQTYQGLSDRFLVDASYLRLRNLQIGYNVPKSLLENTFVNTFSITLQAENLVTWTKWKGFDAESDIASDQGRYPTPRAFTLGFDIKF